MVPIRKLHKLPSNLGPQGEPFFVAKAKPRGTIELGMLLFVSLFDICSGCCPQTLVFFACDLGGFK